MIASRSDMVLSENSSLSFEMSARRSRFEQLTQGKQISAFTKLFEVTLGTHVTNLEEFCESGENIVKFIDACVPGEPLPQPKMIGVGDILKIQRCQYAVKFAVHRGILQEAEQKRFTQSAMDLTKPKSVLFLRFIQAIVNRAGIDLSSFVPTSDEKDHPIVPVMSDEAREAQKLESTLMVNVKRFEESFAVHEKYLHDLRVVFNETEGNLTRSQVRKIEETGAQVGPKMTEMLMEFYNSIAADNAKLKILWTTLGRPQNPPRNVNDPSVILENIKFMRIRLQALVDRAEELHL
jgi:hypothetical protein